jgi:glycosyltransferase involved in cell wall biosynthesis
MYGWALTDFAYVPNGIRVTAERWDTPVPTRRGSVVYSGGFARAHGMGAVIDAAGVLQAAAAPVDLTLYGDGIERAALERRVEREQLANVHFGGLVPKADLPDLLAEAEICICTGSSLPVHRYGISFNKLFDYFYAAKPIVFAVDSGNNPVAAASAGMTVPAEDGTALASAIMELAARDPEDLAQMGERGREFLLKEHDFVILGARLDAFLRRILEKHGGLNS